MSTLQSKKTRAGAASAQELESEIARLEDQFESLAHQIFSDLSPYQVTQLSRHPNRPYTLDVVTQLCEDFMELSGDRNFMDDAAIVGGIAKFRGYRCVIIGHQKGRGTKDNLKRNFGMPRPEGYRKALRLMSLAERFRMPIITFVDTPGAYPGKDAEERGQSEAIAKNIMVMFKLRTPIVTVVLGEGGSGGALAIGVGNRVLMMENSIYSVISPEGCASILWKDGARAPDAAENLGLTAKKAQALGVIDEVIAEPLGAAHWRPKEAIDHIGDALERHIADLKRLSPEELVADRLKKFTRMGEHAVVECSDPEPKDFPPVAQSTPEGVDALWLRSWSEIERAQEAVSRG